MVRYDIKAKSRNSVSAFGFSEDLGDSRYHDNYRQSVVSGSRYSVPVSVYRKFLESGSWEQFAQY